MVTIKVLGKGGHGSVPHMVKDVISCGASIVNNLHTVKSRGVDSKENCVVAITAFNSGFTYNVFPDEATLFGTIRTFSMPLLHEIIDKIKLIASKTAEGFGCTVEFNFLNKYQPTINHVTETEHVVRIANLYFGGVNTNDLPLSGAEDFGFYLKEKPGCFYLLGTKRPGENYALHSSCYDYNDSLLATGACMFLRIVEDRLRCKIL